MISLRRRPNDDARAYGEYRPRHMGLLPAESIRCTGSSLPHRRQEGCEFAGAALRAPAAAQIDPAATSVVSRFGTSPAGMTAVTVFDSGSMAVSDVMARLEMLLVWP